MFIVIEGIDGTGKATQLSLLKERFAALGNTVDTYDFPAYDSFIGKELGQLLAGHDKDINAKSLPGKLMAMLFSLDRMQFVEKIKASIASGHIVISNRYSLSNATFQSIRSGEDISSWVYEMEHGALGLPKPDLYIVLKGSMTSAHENVSSKGKRNYVDGHDVYEQDLDLLKKAQDMYCTLDTGGVPKFIINCMDGDKFKAKDDIADEIIKCIDQASTNKHNLVQKSCIREHIQKCISARILDIDEVLEYTKALPAEQLDALRNLAKNLKESETGKMIGVLQSANDSLPNIVASSYLFACSNAKRYISLMFETTNEIKKSAIKEYCARLDTTQDSVVPMDRYFRQVIGE
ncbi:dTMP kinase [Pseudomonas aeruginosa]|uniref:dTMP kinase n=1 Tax=Pseudomonas aeruginosa TaxID=287 RepID=UPI0008FB4EBB|nr:dTMP kinase [Pseudomonas aeruginosa]MCS8194427.1 dTMP kinase [Pseudomonas aeruginosa]MDG3921789.1 dTMP kinase [Pseudomonas aeruginosa]MDG4009710.1 dTMP kinase [Pseudomonas aeruginosa]MDG4097898.1 dTMP kinase [Pseudomonas aeruginosa]MDG4175031.1 dTMP kinase [Pseudomonas aeruginosa]